MHNEELHNLYNSSNIIFSDQTKGDQMGKSFSMDERLEIYIIFWLENLKGRDHLENLNIDGRIIL